MKAQEFRNLIREEISKIIKETSLTSAKNSRLPLHERDSISFYDGFIATDMKANTNYNYKAKYIKGKSMTYSHDAAKEALKKKVGHDKVSAGDIVILKGRWDATKLPTLELEDAASTAAAGATKVAGGNVYSKAASELFKNVDEILKHYMVDDEYEYEQYKLGIRKIKTQEDLTKWYKNMSKELKTAYGSDSDPIKDIVKDSSAIAKKAGVTLK